MKLQPFLLALTVLNVGLLAAALLHSRPAAAAPQNDQILRGRGLQIVDDKGKVRASIEIIPPTRQKDGSAGAETVLLRLITEQGRPSVKIQTSEQQSGMALVGPTGTNNTYVQVMAGDATSAVVLKNEDGGERRVTP